MCYREDIQLYWGPHEDLGNPVVGTENTHGSKNYTGPSGGSGRFSVGTQSILNGGWNQADLKTPAMGCGCIWVRKETLVGGLRGLGEQI